MFSKGKIIIGHGTKIPLRDADKLSLKYGGKSSDWVKKTSENFKTLDGKKFETHWYENTKTSKRFEFKTKILE
ncbi:MAG: hypothetical protein ACRC4G_04750 [Alphaproteobacteria bacterium]